MIDEKMRTMLAADLPRDVIKTRSQAGQTLSYVSGDYIVRKLNEVFGFDGWTFIAETPREVFRGTRPGKDGDNTVIIYEVRGTLRALGVERVDVGVGQCDAGPRALAQGIEKALKEATTDALKRCARTFGNGFGLALYDKSGNGIGLSTIALALLDEIEGSETLPDLEHIGGRIKAAAIDPDEREVLRGTFVARRRELTAIPVAVEQTAPKQLDTPVPPPKPAANTQEPPALAAYRTRIAACASGDELVAARLALRHTLSAAGDVAAAEARKITADRAKSLFEDAEVFGAAVADAEKITKEPAHWTVVAEVLAGINAATTADATKAVVSKHAKSTAALPDALKARLSNALRTRRAALATPAGVAAAIEEALRAADGIPALDEVAEKIEAAAKAGTVTREQAAALLGIYNARVAELEREPSEEAGA